MPATSLSNNLGSHFRFAEAVQLATMLHHFLGVKKSSPLKFSHILLCNMLIWGVLAFAPSSPLLPLYILVRAFTEMVRHLYNLYETVGAKGESRLAELFRHSHFLLTLAL